METLAVKKVKIRKPHNCWGCAQLFEPRSVLTVVVSVDGGKATSSYWCNICDAYYKSIEQGNEGIYYGDFAGEQHYQEFKEKFLSKN